MGFLQSKYHMPHFKRKLPFWAFLFWMLWVFTHFRWCLYHSQASNNMRPLPPNPDHTDYFKFHWYNLVVIWQTYLIGSTHWFKVSQFSEVPRFITMLINTQHNPILPHACYNQGWTQKDTLVNISKIDGVIFVLQHDTL